MTGVRPSLEFTREDMEQLIDAAKAYHALAPKPYERDAALPHNPDLAQFDDIVHQLARLKGKKINQNHLAALIGGLVDRLVAEGAVNPEHLKQSHLGEILARPDIKEKMLAASRDADLIQHMHQVLINPYERGQRQAQALFGGAAVQRPPSKMSDTLDAILTRQQARSDEINRKLADAARKRNSSDSGQARE